MKIHFSYETQEERREALAYAERLARRYKCRIKCPRPKAGSRAHIYITAEERPKGGVDVSKSNTI